MRLGVMAARETAGNNHVIKSPASDRHVNVINGSLNRFTRDPVIGVGTATAYNGRIKYAVLDQDVDIVN